MNFAAVGSLLQAAFSGSGSISLNNQNVGDLVLLACISVDSSTNYINAVTGGGCSWKQIGTPFTGTTNGKVVTLWEGMVRPGGTGVQTATLSGTGGSPSVRVAGREFTTAEGGWAVDVVAHLDSAGTNTWASLVPGAGAGELYFGFASDGNNASAGSTPGYTYEVTVQGHGVAWDANSGSGAQAPVWGDNSQQFGVMVLVKAAATPEEGPIQKVAGPTYAYGTGMASFTIAPMDAGNLLVGFIEVDPGSATVTSLGSSGVAWARVAQFIGNDGKDYELWKGEVTVPGSQTVTITYSGSVSAVNIETGWVEFVSGRIDPVWSVGAAASQDNLSSTALPYPSLAAAASELYFGYGEVTTTGQAGSTPGFTYCITPQANVIAYNPTAFGAVSPTASATTATTSHAIAVLITDAPKSHTGAFFAVF